MEDGERRRKRGRYKQYAEPANVRSIVPKQTLWNSEHSANIDQAAPCLPNAAVAVAHDDGGYLSSASAATEPNSSDEELSEEDLPGRADSAVVVAHDDASSLSSASAATESNSSCEESSEEDLPVRADAAVVVTHDDPRSHSTGSGQVNSDSTNEESFEENAVCPANTTEDLTPAHSHASASGEVGMYLNTSHQVSFEEFVPLRSPQSDDSLTIERAGNDSHPVLFQNAVGDDALIVRPYVELDVNTDASFLSDLEENEEDEAGREESMENEDSDGGHEEPDQGRGGNVPNIVPHKLLKEKLGGEFSGKMEDVPVASKGEILLNALEFSRRYNLPAQGVEDLHKLINCIFYKEVVPETKYKIDNMYVEPSQVSYFFFCNNCFEEFDQLDHKHVRIQECQNCGAVNQVSDLTKASYYVTFRVANQIELLLNDPNVAPHLKTPQELTTDRGPFMTDMYDGEMYRSFAGRLSYSDETVYLSLTACTDGTPIYKSSNLSIWPLFAVINELPPRIRMSNIVLVGLWFCKHPKMELFLSGCVDAMYPLAEPGFEMSIGGTAKLCKCYVIAFCLDSGARGSVQCVHAHNGECGCNWCLHPGEREGDGSNARKYRNLPQPSIRRTQEEVISDGERVLQLGGRDRSVNGVTGLSPLLRLPMFDIVKGMVVDVLHWASFGVCRQLFNIWMGERKTEEWDPNKPPPFYIGAPNKRAVVNQRINNFQPPLELRRMPRDLSYFKDYNAREYENMILYLSIPMLKNVMPEKYLKHWCKFVQAFYLLMKAEITAEDLTAARALIKEFLIEVEELYGWKEMTFNMHISEHAVENVERWGNLWAVSTYAFENGNGKLKHIIHAQRGIPHQIIRKLGYDSSLTILRTAASTAQTDGFREVMARKTVQKCLYVKSILCMMPSKFVPSREEEWLCHAKQIEPSTFSVCQRIVFNGIRYSSVKSGKTNNTIALLKNGKIVQIRKIIFNEQLESVVLFVSIIKCIPYPCQFHLPFLYTVQLVEQVLNLVDCSELHTICVSSNVISGSLKAHFISVLANAVNMF